jgi:hypothetical protein
VWDALGEQPMSVNKIHDKVYHLDESTLKQVLGKLMTLRAAEKHNDAYMRGKNSKFLAQYNEILKYHKDKITTMYGYTQSKECRVLDFLHYFGDSNDDYHPCEICDNCKVKAQKTPTVANAAVKAEPILGIRPGLMVEHTKYGVGRVTKVDSTGISGQEFATVVFEDGQPRKIITKYLRNA